MPARNESEFPSPDQHPDNPIVPADVIDDDALWMLLNAFADGEATSEEVQHVERLLGTHPTVAREFSFLQLTSHSVREFADVDPPIALTDAIFAATTRRRTLAQRFRGWLAGGIAVLGPAPIRWSTGALAAGVLAVVLWSRYAPATSVPPAHDLGVTTVAPQPPHIAPSPKTAGSLLAHAPVTVTPRSAEPKKGGDLPKLDWISGIGAIPAAAQASAPKPAILPVAPKPRDRGIQWSKSDFAPAVIQAAAAPAGEQRHTATGADRGSNSTQPDDLGPDVEQPTVDPAVVADVAPAAPSHEDPPSATVTLASYRPGSISDKSRNAPPAVQSLYMRTQEAIKRQHELQQYGGYGKDAYNNIQRGEVGLSLVGGRF